MGEDASLDQFIGDESDEQGEAADTAAESAATSGVVAATTTYAWDGSGAVCADCGETVERRWRGADGLVCLDCKDWDRE